MSAGLVLVLWIAAGVALAAIVSRVLRLCAAFLTRNRGSRKWLLLGCRLVALGLPNVVFDSVYCFE
jgi:hypothetical protein